MNPPTFHVTKVDEDPHGRVVDVMGVTTRENAELVAYQLKEVAQV